MEVKRFIHFSKGGKGVHSIRRGPINRNRNKLPDVPRSISFASSESAYTPVSSGRWVSISYGVQLPLDEKMAFLLS